MQEFGEKMSNGQHKSRPKQESNDKQHGSARWFLSNLFNLAKRHGNWVVTCALYAWLAQKISLTLIAFSGKTSLANFSLRFLASVNIVWGISITMSGLSIGLYIRERNLHRRTRERLTARITSLELKIDPKRTSSLLTSEGLTRKEDQ
jgi:hypothetical protein